MMTVIIPVWFQLPNGWRYPLAGGTGQRHFIGINSKPHKLPKNAQTPTSRVHAVLGAFVLRKTRWLKKDNTAKIFAQILP